MTTRPPIAAPTIDTRFSGPPFKAGGIWLDIEDANKEFKFSLEPRLNVDIDGALVSITVLAVGLETGLVDEVLAEKKELNSIVSVTTVVFGAGRSLSV